MVGKPAIRIEDGGEEILLNHADSEELSDKPLHFNARVWVDEKGYYRPCDEELDQIQREMAMNWFQMLFHTHKDYSDKRTYVWNDEIQSKWEKYDGLLSLQS